MNVKTEIEPEEMHEKYDGFFLSPFRAFAKPIMRK